MPSTIERLHREFGARGLSVLAVNLVEDREAVATWVKRAGLTVPVLLDPDAVVATAYRVTATPTAVLVDGRGRIAGKVVGPRDWLGPYGRSVITGLLPARAP